jgi:hypothetical protein
MNSNENIIALLHIERVQMEEITLYDELIDHKLWR